MGSSDPLARLRSDLEALLEGRESGTKAAFGVKLGFSSEDMLRKFLRGRRGIDIRKAAQWAAECGAVLRAVPDNDVMAELDIAIGGLPPDSSLRRHLHAVVASEREAANGSGQPKKVRRRKVQHPPPPREQRKAG